MSESIAAARYDWERQVLASKLPPMTKLVALAAATYADPDGTRVFPGTARLAIVCRVSYDTVRKALRTLRDAGLLERTRQGSRRKAAEYRLIFAEDLVERLEWLTPAQIELEAEQLNRANVEGAQRRRVNPKQRYGEAAHDFQADRPEVLSQPGRRCPPAGDAPPYQRYPDPADSSNSGMGRPETAVLPSHPPTHVPDHTSTNPNNDDVHVNLAVTRAREPVEESQIFIEEEDSNRTETAVRPTRWTSRAQLAIAESRARMDAIRAAHAAGQS